ncbi:hypothetical protein OG689_29230 [Kitasatospora sp. NBC_00240]|uniref:hypothetical protein n=1 Tax=Kitasatospora sp. NBC_00240 TaxID=2903567 RepID=UPI00224CED66|nr:hypothetical protein [Kitasatospora sp. NBC_00240]MCX5213299.1 hypothetical protein [Kitasatospora sp. NBC_00240]
MLTKEIGAGLVHRARRMEDARGRVRSGQSPDRVRYAAQCRREAFKYLVMACGALKGWPVTAQVGPEAVRGAHRILLASDGPEIRRILPLVTAAAQQYRIPSLHLAEAVDALCVAEGRPQVYGTVEGHPVADEARLRAKRAALGLPLPAPRAGGAGGGRARATRPADPAAPQAALGLDVLDGLLADLPPVPALPRTVRRTVDADADWACAYCGGPAPAGSREIEVRTRVWRICRPCADCPDTPEQRLLDMLRTKGGVPEATALATAWLARHEGWKLPLRYEEPRTRPNRRPQPRWAHIPGAAVSTLVLLAERHPARPTAGQPGRPGKPGRLGRPGPARREAAPVLPAPTAAVVARHPGLLVSVKAVALLALAPTQPLTAKEVGKALQLAPDTLAAHGLAVGSAGELRGVFLDPPPWLLEFHQRLAAQRAANRARQCGAAVPEQRAGGDEDGVAGKDGVAGEDGQRAREQEQDGRQPPAPEQAGEAGGVPGPPHPEMLVSGRAEQVLARPHDAVLQPNVVAKSLQTAHATIVKQRLRVRTVGELAGVFHRPPGWLLDFHRKLAAERAANLLKQSGGV